MLKILRKIPISWYGIVFKMLCYAGLAALPVWITWLKALIGKPHPVHWYDVVLTALESVYEVILVWRVFIDSSWSRAQDSSREQADRESKLPAPVGKPVLPSLPPVHPPIQ
jgi:hypothetical protein